MRDQSEASALGADHPITADLGIFVNLAGRLRQSLPSSYLWLGEGDLKVVGTRPIDAGGFADIWVGEVRGRKVAVKSYRCYLSANCTLIYEVSYP